MKSKHLTSIFVLGSCWVAFACTVMTTNDEEEGTGSGGSDAGKNGSESGGSGGSSDDGGTPSNTGGSGGTTEVGAGGTETRGDGGRTTDDGGLPPGEDGKVDTSQAPKAFIEPNCETEVEFPSNISSDTTLEAGQCYTLDGSVVISEATLTIEPGVTVKLKTNAYLAVRDEGALSAVGTAEAPITFMGTIAQPAHWEAVHIDSNNPANELGFVQLAHGGSQATCCRTDRNGGMLLVSDAARISIHDSVFAYSGNNGIEFEPGALVQTFERNAFFGNQRSPVRATPDIAGSLDGGSNYAGTEDAPNGSPVITVVAGSVTKTATWPVTNVPYALIGGLTVSSNLTLAPGVELVVSPDVGIEVVGAGGLIASGTSASPISMRGSVEAPGTWMGILFSSPSPDNQLDYVTLDHGGSDAFCCKTGRVAANVLVDEEARVGIRNSTFRTSGAYGVAVLSRATLEPFERNTMAQNEAAAMLITPDHVAELDSESTFAGENQEDVVVVRGGDTRGGAWPALDVPYRFASNVTLTGPTTIDPGAELIFPADAGLWVDTAGSLKAVSTDEPITFRGVNDQAGFWLGVGFASNSPDNVLDGVIIDGGGSESWCCTSGRKPANILLDADSRAVVQNSVVSRSDGWGIYAVDNAVSLTESGNEYSENLSGDVQMP